MPLPIPSLTAAVEADPSDWLAIAALADAAEEEGQADLVIACRLLEILRRHGRHPKLDDVLPMMGIVFPKNESAVAHCWSRMTPKPYIERTIAGALLCVLWLRENEPLLRETAAAMRLLVAERSRSRKDRRARARARRAERKLALAGA